MTVLLYANIYIQEQFETVLRRTWESIKVEYYYYKCKKLWFIHELTAHYTSKTAKITKR